MIFSRGKLADAMPLLLNHHYLARRTADPMFVFLWTREGQAQPDACAVFCAPCNKYFGGGCTELSRLVRTASVAEPMTKFLAMCFRELRVDDRKFKYVLSYADSTAGHHGGVYQAFNGIHVAVSKGHSLWRDPKTGSMVSNRSKDQRAKENRAGLVKVKTGAKYLYVWPLHEKEQSLLKRFKWTRLPYPKPSTQV